MNTMTSNNSGATVSTTATTTPPVHSSTPPLVVPSGSARVAISFVLRDSDAALIVASGRVISGMTSNPAYASPDPGLVDLGAARDGFIAAVNGTQEGRIGIVVRRQRRAILVELLRRLAHYVQVSSKGDPPTLLGSGFLAQRPRLPVGDLRAPANLRLARGKLSGQLVARCERMPKAGAYQWRYATAAHPLVWLPIDPTLAANITIENLVPGTLYTTQVRVIGTAGPSDWSDTATLMVV
ncbi:MAG TPA: fibronectin type III domain-containing protein [Xanthomonadaceae bacterium]|jgi:hypothetical protein|nr:fibronectin type III domain-containing protein [Xanthomonadaceae bacterium]